MVQQDGVLMPDLPAGVTEFAVVGPGSTPDTVIIETPVKVNSFQKRRKALANRPSDVHPDAGMGRPDRDKTARDKASAQAHQDRLNRPGKK